MPWCDPISLPAPPVLLAREPEEPYGPRRDPHEPPALELRPYTGEELFRLFRGGEREADEAEALLVQAARARGGLALRIGQGLRALRRGRLFQELAFRFADYAREVGIGRSRAYELVAFAEGLEKRPLLCDAVRSGRVKYRAAQEVMPLAEGEAEACWVEKAASETVRTLEREVRRRTDPHFDEQWFKLVPAIAQEYLGEFPGEADELCEGPVTAESWREDLRRLGSIRRTGLRAELEEQRAALMEGENERWSHMPAAKDLPAPAVDLDSLTSARELDRELRRLVRQDEGWDAIIGHRAHALEASGIHRTLGYATFKQYVEERLGLPYRTVARRAKLEERIWASEALQEARRQKLGLEKLWLLSFLPEREMASSVQRAKAMTVIALRRALDRAEEVRMRGQGKLKVLVPRSVAYLLAAALATARRRVDRPLSDGECLASSRRTAC